MIGARQTDADRGNSVVITCSPIGVSAMASPTNSGSSGRNELPRSVVGICPSAYIVIRRTAVTAGERCRSQMEGSKPCGVSGNRSGEEGIPIVVWGLTNRQCPWSVIH